MSTVKSLGFNSIFSVGLFMYKRKSKDLEMSPWGTPGLISAYHEFKHLKLLFASCWLRYCSKETMSYPENCIGVFLNTPFFQTLLKVFEIHRIIALVSNPSSNEQ